MLLILLEILHLFDFIDIFNEIINFSYRMVSKGPFIHPLSKEDG